MQGKWGHGVHWRFLIPGKRPLVAEKGLKVTLSGLYFSGPLAIRGAFSTQIPAAPTHNYLSFLLAFACAG